MLDVLFRIQNYTAEGYSAPKGAELTWEELDDNLKLLADAINTALNGGGNVQPYDNGTEYKNTLPDYVTYGGNLWKCLVSSVTGVIPGTDPTKWELSSAGNLTHQQNTDTILAAGTANQVTAAEIRELLSNQLILITGSTFVLAANIGSLKQNRIYKITDADPVLYVHSYGGYVWNKRGVAVIRTPLVINIWKGDAFGGSYTTGQRVNFDASVYQNLTGNNTDTPPSGDSTNWQLLATNTSAYKDSFFDVDLILQDGAIYPITYRDQYNSCKFGYITGLLKSFPKIDPSNMVNEADYSSNLDVANVDAVISGNVLTHNSFISIGPNSIGSGGGVSSNLLIYGAINCSGGMSGDISGNKIENATLNFDDGLDGSGYFKNCGVSFPKKIELNARDLCKIDGATINEDGSTAEDEITAPAGTCDLEQNGPNDLYGVYWFDSAGGSIDEITGFKNYFPVKIMCRKPGEKLTVTIKGAGGVTDGSLVCNNPSYAPGNYDLNADNGEYLKVIEQMLVDGNTVLLVDLIKVG